MFKWQVVYQSNKHLIQRVSLIFVLLILGGGGIFSEENSKHSPTSFSNLYQTHQIHVRIKQKDFIVFQPVDYSKPVSIQKFNFKPAAIRSTSIMGKGHLNALALADFLTKNNPDVSMAEAKKIAKLYIEESVSEGVNYDVAFSQMCLETGFLRYTGQVHPLQNNFCGLGVVNKGTHGMTFPSERIGIRAHIQHLKAYASTASLHHKLVDTRFRFVRRGSIKNIDDLTGKWATDKHYGRKIHSLLNRLYQTR